MSKLVLIADDHEIVRSKVSLMLQKHGFRVGSAENGAEAVRKAQEERPDLIILDFLMPGMNGIETARVLRFLMPQVPVVMFTSVAGATIEGEAKRAGISGLFSKLEPMELLLAHAKSFMN
jgi:CheY-like chemotaxis protein